MRSWGWDEAQARARRARESGPRAFGRVAHASARRSISGARRAGVVAGKKAALVARIHQFAPTPPVSPRHASPKWAAITGAANATDTGCVV
jgi:hypothetical protein